MANRQLVVSLLSALGLSTAAVAFGMASNASVDAACKRCAAGTGSNTAPACNDVTNQAFGASHCTYTIDNGSPPTIYCTQSGFRSCSG